MPRVLKGLPDRFEVGYEASCGYGHYHDLLPPLAVRVLVAHPGCLRPIPHAKDKNDRWDAERLAKLLYQGEAPTVHVPALEALLTPSGGGAGAAGVPPSCRRSSRARGRRRPIPGRLTGV
jgi:hypothetical protein